MKNFKINLFMFILFLLFNFASAPAIEEESLEADAIISKILAVEAKQRAEIQTLTFDAEYIEKESDGNGGYFEKVRLEKKIRLKYLPDTVLYNEEYIRYLKNGEVRPDKECEEVATERKEKKKRRGSRDISWPILLPFKPASRGSYDISYQGVNDSAVTGLVCHHFKVASTTEDEKKINGDYFFDAASFQLAKAEIEPAKLGGNIFFKLNKLEMSVSYGPTAQGHWLPQLFEINGKGKATFFIGVDWEGTEYFHNPQINTGISDELFKTDQD